ncbi:DUF418 domain-containing protein [Corynebacterium sp. 153RC1]|uniref:DUF418 domain-containing protein n=1 Tax=unclassified Corynebacterium TaxID=2624378 RepID=UPI00211BCFC9|nr:MULTISPECIES: DUF418 domain-containing protein [unclassified Corynebacterium]MCQ9371141.1 DUF418 domain-containing protein [Corynebacterium sp. 35RC1]MCQ9352558.1 DUF418 domain-containing protein [Corynebacterium sp. 209RC1]MCQ9354742.1 DUF418 domain-containing protein [Corynebacterium sp. 1222RC1]MCQ9356853.1 DUF418 domain-containing protein [Corynebacterium sp. 122RC1]MCQ9358943.1 DUF418 domain-containing protein [Corynebacterium sp. 142RC1]
MDSLDAQYSRRLVAPDLARGFALLGIAIANAITAWSGDAGETGFGIVRNTADSMAGLFGAMFVHVRGIALFSTLLGYGIGMIYARELQKGHRATRVILRRYAWLAGFGVLHAIFLFWGDIMVFYGLAGMAMCLVVRLKDKALLTIAAALAVVWIGVMGLLTALSVVMGGVIDMAKLNMAAPMVESYLDQLVAGAIIVASQPLSFFGVIFMLGPCILVGFVAGRRGMMWHVPRYLPLLRALALITFGLCIILGAVWWFIGINGMNTEAIVFINTAVGPLSGPGFLAMFALLAHWVERRGGVGEIFGAVAALGSMSMSGYVAQSVLFGLIMAPYGLGVGYGGGAAYVTGVAVFVWLVTVLVAGFWRSLGKRGPVESIHRKVGYSPKLA